MRGKKTEDYYNETVIPFETSLRWWMRYMNTAPSLISGERAALYPRMMDFLTYIKSKSALSYLGTNTVYEKISIFCQTQIGFIEHIFG